MPVDVNGTTFYNISEVSEVVGVTRQSIWRWRKNEKIPPGRKFRGRDVLYTQDEMERIFEYAHRMEPAGASNFEDQMRLFE